MIVSHESTFSGSVKRATPLTWPGNEVNCLYLTSTVSKTPLGTVAEYKVVLMQKYKEAVKDEA